MALWHKLYSVAQRVRLPLVIAVHIALFAGSYLAALLLRFDLDIEESFVQRALLLPILVLVLTRFAAYTWWDLNRGSWRYASTRDLLTLVKAHVASTTAFVAVVALARIPDVPRSVILIDFGLSLFLSGGLRFMVRIASERFASRNPEFSGIREVVILGAGDSGHLLVKNLLSQKRIMYRPVAVLDDSERLQGSKVDGVPVCGTLSELEATLLRLPRVSAVIAAIPSLSSEKMSRIRGTCTAHDVPLKRLQSFEDIACADALSTTPFLSIESVLEKEVDIEHESEIREALSGKRILVTGAGGSIGSELVRQILPFGPAELTLVDMNEYNLFRIERELSGRHDDTVKHFCLGNICDAHRLQSIMSQVHPQIVFHAAAYKHVPLMEANCYEAFCTNVLGTRNTLQAAWRCGAEQFVMISTDKAVDPSSIMGCTKRIAEALTQSYHNASRTEGSELKTAVVRFGNVINSNGSVIPLFREQILSGGPITVTHPQMERFFMSIREAVRLVLTAGILGTHGEIYLLDMGKPIKIVDVARKMRALYGRRDIPIVFTGIRPGEKLSEVLTDLTEEQVSTTYRKIRKLQSKHAHPETVRQWVESFDQTLRSLPDEVIAEEIRLQARMLSGRASSALFQGIQVA